MNAPPHEPPLVFRYDTMALLTFSRLGLGCIPICIYSIFNLARGYRITMAWVYCAPIILITGFLSFVVLNVLFKRIGASVEIRNGKLRGINRGGKVRVEGKISDIVELKSLYLKPNEPPMEFQVVFADRRSLRFEAQVERCEELKRALEQRTGKAFVLAPRSSSMP